MVRLYLECLHEVHHCKNVRELTFTITLPWEEVELRIVRLSHLSVIKKLTIASRAMSLHQERRAPIISMLFLVCEIA